MKRRKLVLLLCLLATTFGLAQTYHPMLKEGKKWYYYWTNSMYEMTVCFSIEGDTVIGGENYYKMYHHWVNQWTGETFMPKRLYALLTEQDRAVYKWNNGQKKQMVNFNRRRGEKMGNVFVTAVDSIYVMGNTLKRMRTAEDDGMAPGRDLYRYWIEGVGCIYSLFGDMPGTHLISCFEDGRCIFTGMNVTDMPSRKVIPEERPLIEEGKQWWYYCSTHGHNNYMALQGDSLIDGILWKKEYLIDRGFTYEKAIREEQGRVYELRPNGQPQLLMDFTLNVGDSFVPADMDDHRLEVIAVDTMMSAGIAHRRLILQQHVNGVLTDLTCWVEGIGTDCGIHKTAKWSDTEIPYVKQEVPLISFIGCAVNGRCIYGDVPETEAILPVTATARPSSARYDLQGRRLNGQPVLGLYIENGRKVLTK